jgi:hypothetical protein
MFKFKSATGQNKQKKQQNSNKVVTIASMMNAPEEPETT